ncbi:hypothetical protein ACFVZD_37660 [Streptomyces sp. NPDC058287]|uniref:hypothetical protein n=1 Tax=unclassified Streptomyces TaxID=2593676 RepID=UPI0036E4AE48
MELIAGDSLEDFRKAESARALPPTVNDLVEQRPPAPAGQGAVPGHLYAAAHLRHAVRPPAGALSPLRAALHGRRADPRGAPGPRLGHGRT